MTKTQENKRFLGKTVVITGGTTGIGAAAVRAFVAEGAQVFFCGREDDLGKSLEEEITKEGGKAYFVHADVRDVNEVKYFFEKARETLGGIDIAFNNAGINHPPNLTGDIPIDEFEDIIATNLNGVFYAMREELKTMTAGGGGCIINTASFLSEKVSGWMAAYSASKAGVLALSQSAAEDYKDQGVRVYALSPGPVDTPMFHKALREIAGDESKYAGGLRPPLAPERVAEAVLMLADANAAPPSGTNYLIVSDQECCDFDLSVDAPPGK